MSLAHEALLGNLQDMREYEAHRGHFANLDMEILRSDWENLKDRITACAPLSKGQRWALIETIAEDIRRIQEWKDQPCVDA